jgi:hypothetical protein
MTSCAEIREELIWLERGTLAAPAAAEVSRHLEACAECAADLAALRRTMACVRPHLSIDPSPDSRMRLRATLDRELARSRSAAKLRARLTFFVPAAAAAAAAIWGVATWSGAGHDAPEPVRGPVAVAPSVPPSVAPSAQQPVARAVAGGLDWLASRQRADGTWSPGPDAGRETVAAVTASVVLAFAANGESAWHGPRREALRRAGDRLAEMTDAGFSHDADAKPLYAQALAVRALAAQFAADRDAMPAASRRARHDTIVRATRQLVEWQGDDGGFGYAPRSPRPDASCTLFAAAALAEVHRSGVTQPSGALARAGRWLEGLRDASGAVAYERPGDRHESPVLTAATAALQDELRIRPQSGAALDELTKTLASSAGRDALLAWEGAGALARHGRAGDAPAAALVDAQRRDGAWPAATDLRCKSGGDDLTTAFGVLALSVAQN